MSVKGWSSRPEELRDSDAPGGQQGSRESNPGADDHVIVHSDAGTACCVGPVWYRRRFGRAALRALLEDIDSPGGLEETQLKGNFVAFLRTGSGAWLLNDPLGFAHLYTSADFAFHCTSWLATRAYTRDMRLDEEAAAEYVLLGAVHDDGTVARSVRKLPLGLAIDVPRRCHRNRFPDGMIPPEDPYPSLDAAVEAIAPMLQGVFADIASAFPDRVSMALSGGFDSRLILAGLMSQGVRPRLFVYGRPDSDDVRVARAVAEAEGLPIDVVDKDAKNRTLPEPSLDTLKGNSRFFDGLPNDGILDAGADRLTRIAQSAGGYIALNGGGGEIYRNFFHLPDRRFSVRQVVQSFYRAFDPKVFRRPGALVRYEARLVAAMERTLVAAGVAQADSRDRRMTRGFLELLYPLFRCHHWMGLNNSLALRQGQFHTPLLDLGMVRRACRVPLRWKNAGLFESRLITTLEARIASHPSTYGFAFNEGPGESARILEWLTRIRPPGARPLINAAKRVMGGAHRRSAMDARHREHLPGQWWLDDCLELAHLSDDQAVSRAFAVEVMQRDFER
jgi:asparagine synthase (glutamine-hydrolysing)